MKAMESMKDNAFDLAIVDPPYGIGESKSKRENCTERWAAPKKKHTIKNWDIKPPPDEYFYNLFRISKNQIIWGGNYFNLPPSAGWIYWDKMNGDFNLSDGELAYTSFNKGLRKFQWLWSGFRKQKPEERIHPTQKPIQLYKWLLKNYANPGDKILDTHGGSMSIALACHDMKFDLDLYELDKDYYKAGVKRYNQHIRQLQLF